MIVTPPFASAVSADRARSQPRSVAFGSFGEVLEAAQQSSATPPTAALVSLNAVLLHEIAQAESRHRDREAKRRGKQLLDALSELQGLSLGAADVDTTLDRIAGLLSAMPQAEDPRLVSIVRAIAVRATVEVFRRRPT